ncbi:MAG: hypothetical protein ACLQMH_17200 [Solirubrobacteraceae bacterium]
MATATKRTSRTTTEHHPPPVGAAEHEKSTWLDTIPAGLPWLDPLREKHREAAFAFADSVGRLGDVRAERHDAERAYREQVRDHLAAGEAAPPRPEALDAAHREAALAIAAQDVTEAREAVCALATETLGVLRANRIEVDFSTSNPALLGALSLGGPNQYDACVAAARVKIGDVSDEVAVIT